MAKKKDQQQNQQANDQQDEQAAEQQQPEPDISQAQQARLDEFYRTHRPPAGYAFNVTWPEKIRRVAPSDKAE